MDFMKVLLLLEVLGIKPDHELWVVEELGESLLSWVPEPEWARLTVEAHAPPHSGAWHSPSSV